MTAPESTRAAAAALLAGADPPGPRLIVLAGPRRGERLALRDGAVLGRGGRADLRLDDPHTSRRHARFCVRGGRWAVSDLSSKNGVLVNGRRPPPGGLPLAPGDELAVGETRFTFEADTAARELAAAGRTEPERAASTRSPRLAAGVLLALAAALAAAGAAAG